MSPVQVYATMRNHSQSPLAETAAREKLTIRVSQMDVDSDESVRDGIAASFGVPEPSMCW